MNVTKQDIMRVAQVFESQGLSRRRIAVNCTPEELAKLMGYRDYDKKGFPKEHLFMGQIVYAMK
jgi:hypothetical protein